MTITHNRGDSFYMEFNEVGITTDYRTVSYERMFDTVDTSAADDVDKEYITGLEDSTGSITLLDNGADGTAILRQLYEGASALLLWSGPEGTAVGKPLYSCTAIITSVQPSFEPDGEVVRTYQWQRTGPFVIDTISDTGDSRWGFVDWNNFTWE